MAEKSIILMTICNLEIKFNCVYLKCILFSVLYSNPGSESLNQNHTLEKALHRGGQGKGKEDCKTLL